METNTVPNSKELVSTIIKYITILNPGLAQDYVVYDNNINIDSEDYYILQARVVDEPVIDDKQLQQVSYYINSMANKLGASGIKIGDIVYDDNNMTTDVNGPEGNIVYVYNVPYELMY